MGTFIGYCFISVLASNFVIYILASFFRISTNQRKKLYHLVSTGKQLRIIKEWEEMQVKNIFYTILGMFLNLCLWIGAFYVSISYVAVWRDFAFTWLLGFCFSFVLDIIIFEFGFEIFISMLFSCRKKSQCSL